MTKYQIISEESYDIKALTKKLSELSPSSIASAPIIHRKSLRILITGCSDVKEVKRTIARCIEDLRDKEPELDEISVLVYDRLDDSDSIYTIAKVDWAPLGEWGSTTPYIATKKDRSSYRYNFDIRKKVGPEYLKRRPSEKEYSIFDAFNKYLDKNDRLGDDEAYKEISKVENIPECEVRRIYLRVIEYQYY